ncbi:hypothetical protein [Catenuloplanes indicus]|uniref:Uncharacterized protein n=1 Tax=Catenuloplanes indicus TaxID=137267 RepID=A0AAE3WAY6_9ACTN|nr:hypothetical protein [Catenuloplanes indicus]MDQ0363358.1 hypothetical protein [Catenuloplanes indicus]MDQ0371680.1 hypothetical protein [Catenuloplanes indicus]
MTGAQMTGAQIDNAVHSLEAAGVHTAISVESGTVKVAVLSTVYGREATIRVLAGLLPDGVAFEVVSWPKGVAS